MKLFVLRHGETNENITGMMQGDMDTVLNEKGCNQALSVRNKVLENNIDLVISSPKKRAIKTAELAAPNIPLILDDRLRSRNHGEFEGMRRDEININDYYLIVEALDYANVNKKYLELNTELKNLYNLFKSIIEMNNQYIKAESVKDLFDRVESLLKEIKEKYNDKNVLLVTHSGIVRILYYYFNGIPEDGNLMEYESHNCSFEQYEL